MDELKSIISVLNNDKTPVSVDIDKRNIIFWFDDTQDSSKINKIAVDLNYKLKKYGVTNYMVTVGKVERVNKDEIEYVKIR